MTPTKRPQDENFPVASLALARKHREAALAFYAFVRMADDIADAPDLASADKLMRLELLDRALVLGDAYIPAAKRLHDADRVHGAGLAEARELLRAFRQDAVKSRYEDWAELVGYCRLSANPVGRFLLRLHGEGEAARTPADALCTALQVLNHLQDCARDRDNLDRVYIPQSWLPHGEQAFFDPARRDARRGLMDAMLDRVDALIDRARCLPQHLTNRRLRAQSTATLLLAERLSARLRSDDPVLARVEVSRSDAALAFARGLKGFVGSLARNTDATVAAAAVRRSGSSFRLGMQSLPHERRRGIHAVYAFCRAVDDIADGAAPLAEKRRFLDEWRREIDRLSHQQETPIGRELAWAAERFALPLEECHALLDGMETDSASRVRITGDEELDRYARRVAGSVGVLSIHVFGAPEARGFALGLGRTLQLVNILRDVDEDAANERIYVPLSRLGLADAPAADLVANPRFARACEALAEEARAGFAAADAALAGLDRAALKPAILMMESYRCVLERLIARGWGTRQGRLHLTAVDRLHLLSRAMRPA